MPTGAQHAAIDLGRDLSLGHAIGHGRHAGQHAGLGRARGAGDHLDLSRRLDDPPLLDDPGAIDERSVLAPREQRILLVAAEEVAHALIADARGGEAELGEGRGEHRHRLLVVAEGAARLDPGIGIDDRVLGLARGDEGLALGRHHEAGEVPQALSLVTGQIEEILGRRHQHGVDTALFHAPAQGREPPVVFSHGENEVFAAAHRQPPGM